MSPITVGKKKEKSYDDGLWDGVRCGCLLSVVIAVAVLAALGLGYLVGMG